MLPPPGVVGKIKEKWFEGVFFEKGPATLMLEGSMMERNSLTFSCYYGSDANVS